MSRKTFGQIIVCDFEYEVADGDLPTVLCMVAYVLDAKPPARTHHSLWRGVAGKPLPPINVWRGEFGKTPPFDIGPDTLFVAYSAWAEMTCFKVLGWKFPVHIFDQHTAYLAASNVLLPYDPDEERMKQKKGLMDACRAYGIVGWEYVEKKEISKDIGEGRWQKYGTSRCLRLLRRGRQEFHQTITCATARPLRPPRPYLTPGCRCRSRTPLVKL